jgi:hypothetical protein
MAQHMSASVAAVSCWMGRTMLRHVF